MKDLVLFLGSGSKSDDWEAKYCIRSAAENFSDLNDVWVIGDRPSWASMHLTFVPFPEEPSINKDHNIINKLAYVSTIHQLTESFVATCDDHFFMKPTTAKEILPLATHSLEEKIDRRSAWQRRMSTTKMNLGRLGCLDYNYDIHAPQLLTKAHCIELLKYNFYGPGACIFTLYFNTLFKGRKPEYVTKEYLNDSRYGFVNHDSRFLCINDDTMKSNEFKQYMEAKFPNKSKYEL